MKDIYCEACNKTRQQTQNAPGGHEKPAADNSEDFNTSIFPTDYIKKKRLYIVRNLEEIN